MCKPAENENEDLDVVKARVILSTISSNVAAGDMLIVHVARNSNLPDFSINESRDMYLLLARYFLPMEDRIEILTQ